MLVKCRNCGETYKVFIDSPNDARCPKCGDNRFTVGQEEWEKEEYFIKEYKGVKNNENE